MQQPAEKPPIHQIEQPFCHLITTHYTHQWCDVRLTLWRHLRTSASPSVLLCSALHPTTPHARCVTEEKDGGGGRRENMQLISTDRWHLVTSSDRWHLMTSTDRWHLVMSSDRWHLVTSTDRWHLVTSNDSKKCHAGPGGGCSRTTLTLTHSLTH